MTSSAFDHIEDPGDPAWTGHVQGAHASRRRQVALAGAVVVATAVLVVFVIAVARAATNDASERRAAPAAATEPAEVIAPEPRAGAPRANAVTGVAGVPQDSSNDDAAYAGGSGWAPAAATISPADRVSDLLVGDLSGLHPLLIERLDELALALGREVEVISGWRTRHEQESLYDRFLAGTGNLAAVPGTSMHESGLAADVYVDDVALASVRGAEAVANGLGLTFPVPGEAWHVELG